AELGVPGCEAIPFYGFWAPAGTPKEALDQFGAALAKAIAQPDVREKFANLGLATQFMTASQLAARERAYSRAWAQIVRKSGFSRP
ncbi:MAG: tripartite tricarboxylate transporter substrate-binding protein, partial [Betaproteobacteria bacterium]